MISLINKWVRNVILLFVVGLLVFIGTGCTKAEAEPLPASPDDNTGISGLSENTESLVILAGGIALRYEHNNQSELIKYPVDAVYVYEVHEFFASVWNDRNVQVELAWIGGDQENTWRLYVSDQALIPTPDDSKIFLSSPDVNVSHWFEYLVYTESGIPDSPGFISSSVKIQSFDPQSVIQKKTIDSMDTPVIANLGPDDAGKKFAQFLLFDIDSGQNILVLILDAWSELVNAVPIPPAPGDTPGEQQCQNCYWGICNISCWWN